MKGGYHLRFGREGPAKKTNYSHEGSPNAGFSVGKFSTKPGEEGVASDLMNQEWWVYGNASGEGNYVVCFLGNTMFGQNLLVCSHYCQTNKKCVDDLPYKNGGLTWFNRQTNGFVVDIIADLSLLSWFTTRLGFTAHICILNVGYNRTYKWRAPHCTTDQFRQLHQHVWWISWKVQVFHYLPNFLYSISYTNNLLSDMFLCQTVNARKYHTEPSVKRYPLHWTDDLTLG